MPPLAAEYALWPTLPWRPAPLVVLIMRASTGSPALVRARQKSTACRPTQKCPRKCTCMVASHSSTVALTNMRSRTMPALFTMTSSVPNASTAVRMMLAAPSQSATSSPLATASPPEARISSTTACAVDKSRPMPARLAPKSLPATFAHGLQAEAHLALLHLVQQRGHQTHARGTERVAQRYGPAVHVHAA